MMNVLRSGWKQPGLPLVMVFLMAATLYAGGGKEAAAPGTAPIVVRAATGGMPRPFTYVDESGKLAGHNIELVQAVFERLPQYKLELEVTDFPSIFAGLDAGRYQVGVNNFAENEERKQKYIFSDPIFKNRYVAAVAASNTALGSQVKTLRDLAGKTTANSVGINVATAIENYNKANPEAQILQTYSDADLLLILQEVEQGKWDFNLIDKPMYEVYQKEFNLALKGIELSDDVSGNIMSTPFSYLIISRGNEQLAADINRALREVILDGTSKRINEKYFGSDYSPEVK
ncbi:MAG: transporter substrate-binding domain-containing protein [Treponema sp.]|jgi:polar amino acid transport system substrate-binding protein|nr:transporter substrate-binding domain-containing protein [Treponema sp.]